MQVKTIPGTVLPYHPQLGPDTFGMVSSLCSIAGGLSLSQITGITGLEASTIQNWVKRGWVARPDGKKYKERQIAQILMINVMRDCIQLEKIAALMSYVNGSADDSSDDIIDEDELYNRLCAIIFSLEEKNTTIEEIRQKIKLHLVDYEGPKLDSKECLSNALEIMVTAYLSSSLKQQADAMLNQLFDTEAKIRK